MRDSVMLRISSDWYYCMWSPSFGLDNPTALKVMASPSQTTSYIVTAIKLFGDSSCISQDTVTVFVNNCIPDSSWLKKGHITTGIAQTENTQTELQIFPNPLSGGPLTIVAAATIRSINLIGMMGQKMPIVVEKTESSFKINVQNIPNGIYFLLIETQESILKREISVANVGQY